MEVEAGGAGAVGRLPEFLGAVLGGDRRALFTSEDDGVRLRADVAGQMLIEEVGQLGRDGDSAPAGVGPGGPSTRPCQTTTWACCSTLMVRWTRST